LGGHHGKNFQDNLKTDIAENQTKIAKLEADRGVAVAEGKDVSNIDRKIAKRKADIADTQKVMSGQAFSTGEADNETPSFIRPFIENARDNPDLVSMRVQDAASKYSWLLIPFSVPFMWLLFPFRRRFNTYDHTVFVTYSLSFMMLLVVAGGLLVEAGMPGLASLLFFVPPLHMYRHLKQTYELGRWSAIMRTMALLTFAFIAAGLFLAAAVAIGAM
jgi:hypothetical protein